MSSLTSLRITALAGGVGAARFLRGVVRVVPETNLSVIVNTGDDEEFFGLSVSPDLDTVTYTLANAVDSAKGWGLPQETHRCLEALGRYYADTWFGLGDSDLATHLFRTQALGRGQTLSQVTEAITHKWDIEASVLPMSNERVRTVVHTEAGALPFQEYFVKQRSEGHVSKVEFRGLETAQASTWSRRGHSRRRPGYPPAEQPHCQYWPHSFLTGRARIPSSDHRSRGRNQSPGRRNAYQRASRPDA